jgi:hypothetical protein
MRLSLGFVVAALVLFTLFSDSDRLVDLVFLLAVLAWLISRFPLFKGRRGVRR